MPGSPSSTITSPKNPRIREIARLRDRRWRDRLERFPVEGRREVGKALAANAQFVEFLYCPALFTDEGTHALVLQAQDRGIDVIEVSPEAFERVSYRDRADGVLAVVRAMKSELDDIVPGAPALLLVVEAIEKPGNLGAVLRSCDGVGADAVIVSDGVTDIFNPNVVRASLGTLFSRPVIECSSRDALGWLRAHRIGVVAASPDAGELYTDAELRGDIAIVVGAEDRGLSDCWLEGADRHVAIPMSGDADSLNVAMAATLILYEALRQRRG